MISRRAKGLENFVLVAKATVLTAAFWLTFGILQLIPREEASYPVDRYVLYNVVAVLGLLFACFREEISGIGFFQNDFLRSLRTAGREVLFVFLALTINLVLTKDLTVSRAFLLLYSITLSISLVLAQRWLPALASKWFYGGSHRHETLLVGSPRRARQLEGWLENVSAFGIHATGLLTDATDSSLKIPVLGSPEQLPDILGQRKVGSVILLDTPPAARLRSVLECTEAAGVRLVVLNTLAEDFECPLRYYHHHGVDFITFREEPLQDPSNRMIKRTFDLLVAGFATLFVLPPLVVAVWIVQRFQAPGPLFYRQARSGMQNQNFRIFKFRTMRVHTEDAARQATQDDDRIYPIGRFLRKTSLDEIPQFLNVLLGEMSVVGPRPHMIEHNDRFAKVQRDYHVRTFVRPGVTGLAQISGFRGEARTMDDIRERVRCDLEYIEHWSLALDMKIVIRTALDVIHPPKTAY